MPDRITKRPFLAAIGCPTAGWRLLRAEQESVTPALEWRFWVGAEVHRQAQRQLGEGRELIRTPVERAVAETAAALHGPGSLLFEATFQSGPFVARADALRRDGMDWELIEVKSGKVPERLDKLNAEYVDDLSYTAFVAGAAGFGISRCVLMLINRDYRLDGAEPLLTEIDLSEVVRSRAQEFSDVAPEIAAILLGEVEPPGVLKFVCRSCEFFTTCVGAGITDPLFDIPRLLEKKFETLKPYGRISALPSGVGLTPIQERVVRVSQSRTPELDQQVLGQLSLVAWPTYYLDFEGIGPALPWFAEAEPYEQMPFQFSIHRVEEPGSVPVHSAYLALDAGDWRQELCQRLLDDLGDRGSIVVYSGYEKGVLNYLMRTVPGEKARLEAVASRLFDLEPVVRNGYCHPGFHGKSSIKAVLPAMALGHSYDDLAVRGGDDAAAIFALMRIGKYDGTADSRHRADLLRYCAMDTMAMIKVHEALVGLMR